MEQDENSSKDFSLACSKIDTNTIDSTNESSVKRVELVDSYNYFTEIGQKYPLDSSTEVPLVNDKYETSSVGLYTRENDFNSYREDATSKIAYDFLFQLSHLNDKSSIKNLNEKDSLFDKNYDKLNCVAEYEVPGDATNPRPPKGLSDGVILKEDEGDLDINEVKKLQTSENRAPEFFRIMNGYEFLKLKDVILNNSTTPNEAQTFLGSLIGTRIVLSNSQDVPVNTLSVLKPEETSSIKLKSNSKLNKKIEAMIKKKKQTMSYAKLLVPSKTSNSRNIYSPFALDNFELVSEKKCTVTTLPGFINVTIYDEEPEERKFNQDDILSGTSINVDPSITVTQIRNIKLSILEIGHALNLDITVMVCAYVYFEKLLLGRYINKSNRKVVAGSCLLLSEKVNDCEKSTILRTLELADKYLGTEKHEIKYCEFEVYAALNFDLFLSISDFIPHLDRMNNLINHRFLSNKSSVSSE